MSRSSSMIRFGRFCLDTATRELRTDESDITLPPKAMACLLYLIAQRDRAVSRDELISAVWGHLHLSDGALAQTILQLRRALEDGEGTQYVKSVRGFGYRWTALTELHVPTEPEPARASTPEAPNQNAGATVTTPTPARYPRVVMLVLSLLALSVLTAYWLRRQPLEAIQSTPSAPHLALVLPVDIDANPSHQWIRLGMMDLVASRLRESGLRVVPSDNVILLENVQQNQSARVQQLQALTGSRWILAPRARFAEHRWAVSIVDLASATEHPLARAEAPEILTATQLAAEQVIEQLGLSTLPREDAQVQLLLQRVEAASLGAQPKLALQLLERAPELLGSSVKLQLSRALVLFELRDYERSLEQINHVLQITTLPAENHLRALALKATVQSASGEFSSARKLLLEVVKHAEASHYTELISSAHMNLGVAAIDAEQRTTARSHFAQAQRYLAGGGDIRALARLERNIGFVDFQEDRYTEALAHFVRAREGFEAIGDRKGLAQVLAAMLEANLQQLNLPEAVRRGAELSELLRNYQKHEAHALASPLSLAMLAREQGQRGLAWERLKTLDATQDPQLRERIKVAASAVRARWLIQDNQPQAAILAAQAVIGAARDDPQQRGIFADAARQQVLGLLATGQTTAATVATQALLAWSPSPALPSTRIFLRLTQAELAAAKQEANTGELYRVALIDAQDSAVPALTLEVANSYVPWLLKQNQLDAALTVSAQLHAYADQHFGAALIRLRVLQRLGPASSWRAALERCESLAGDRAIPPELMIPPS